MHETAPDLLWEKTVEMIGILNHHKKSKNPNPKQIAWYEDFIKVLKFNFFYIQHIKSIAERNEMLESQNKHFAFLIQQLQDQLNEFLVISRLEAENRLESVQDIVNATFEAELAKKYKKNGAN